MPWKTLRPATSASAIAPTKLPGPGTKAKKRGWSTCIMKGSTSCRSRASTSSGARPALGHRLAEARLQLCARLARPVTRCSGREAKCSTIVSTTR